MRHDLFSYGTLQIPAVMQAVVGRRFVGRAALLDGYAAVQIRGTEYPGLVRSPGKAARGLVYFDLAPGVLTILDRFEGRLYRRCRLTVRTLDGRRRGVWVYIVKPDRKKWLTAVAWNRQTFMRRQFRRFMQRFVMDRRPVFEPQAGNCDETGFWRHCHEDGTACRSSCFLANDP